MNYLLKRTLDVAVAALLLLMLWPLLLVTAILVRRKLGAPLFFTQTRIGKNQKPFTLLKFRSMTDERDTAGKLLDDSARLTAFGRALRASSIDELPQLWNIIIGDMSLIGPRPLLPEYLPYYTAYEAQRHIMRPGITGLAQVSGRNTIGWDARLALDTEYVEQFNFTRDLMILWRTIIVVLQRKGISARGAATMPRLDVERASKEKP